MYTQKWGWGGSEMVMRVLSVRSHTYTAMRDSKMVMKVLSVRSHAYTAMGDSKMVV